MQCSFLLRKIQYFIFIYSLILSLPNKYNKINTFISQMLDLTYYSQVDCQIKYNQYFLYVKRDNLRSKHYQCNPFYNMNYRQKCNTSVLDTFTSSPVYFPAEINLNKLGELEWNKIADNIFLNIFGILNAFFRSQQKNRDSVSLMNHNQGQQTH